ncbi:HAD family hydrolase [uncultured Enterovirga sp.]|uniref:HAD family hydrolase n=1 Tax=uncultured Enterovirga sp. TaxID=2026352 RepID=UPI0035CB1B59
MIRLVVSDVDGTLVQPDKSLAPSTVAAANRLRSAGIPLAIVSARPPRGIAWIADELGLAFTAGFNGGTVVRRDGTLLESHLVPADAARTALDLLVRHGIDAWLFTETEWLVVNPTGSHVPHERMTVRFDERVVESFEPYIAQAGKITGVTDDAPRLAAVEAELQALLGQTASAKRSQSYYLDVTNQAANKGNAVRLIARHAGVDPSEVAVLGDMANDLPMFDVAGFSIAMGNASAEVKARASAVTDANDADGWARAVDRLILARRTE